MISFILHNLVKVLHETRTAKKQEEVNIFYFGRLRSFPEEGTGVLPTEFGDYHPQG